LVDAEDKDKDLWKRIDRLDGQPIGPEGLRQLQDVPEETVETFRQIKEEIRAKSGGI